MIIAPMLPKYQSFWHVYVPSDLNNPKAGRSRAQIVEVAFNTRLAQNIYHLELFSQEIEVAHLAGVPYYLFVPCPKLKIVRLESQIISRA